MAHRDIRIPFEIEVRKFEAVGFLNDDDVVDGVARVRGGIMFERTSHENGGAISGEDATFFFKHCWKQLPVELEPYFLVTNLHNPEGCRGNFGIFYKYKLHWNIYWEFDFAYFFEDHLVVRCIM